MIDKRQPANDEVAHPVPRQQRQDVLEIANGLHGRSDPVVFAPVGDSDDVRAERDQRGQPLFGRLALPELQVPPVCLRKTVRPMGADDALPLLGSFSDAHGS